MVQIQINLEHDLKKNGDLDNVVEWWISTQRTVVYNMLNNFQID